MKKIMFIIAFLGIVSMMNAEDYNPLKDDSGVMTAKVIKPFRIWDITPNGNPFLCEVIKGQVKVINDPDEPNNTELNTEGSVMLFQMEKETMKEVMLTLSLPNPVGGVELTAQWYFLEGVPPATFTWPNTAATQIGQTFRWYFTQTEGWIALLVHKIDARQAQTTGRKTFVANASGYYSGM